MKEISDSSTESEQEFLLESALKVIKNESFEMKRFFDRSDLMEGLKHASQMLAELRTSALNPKFYYRLYVDVTNELRHFLSFLADLYLGDDRSRKVSELYESVQYTGNIVPRLYLLITVGVIYMKSGETPPKVVLKDLVEMCRGVQHPLRGLFLRNYLLISTKDFLPDALTNGVIPSNDIRHWHSTISGEGTVIDAIDFVMTNFSEMNKLWVRMQHQGLSREHEKRENERRELRILIGANLVKLSKLENLDLELYRKIVLPGILEQSVSCKEPISQEYLMECIIQAFPDHFHLATLTEFLDACTELHPCVKIKNVLGTLIDHLTLFASSGTYSIPTDIQLFEIFSKHADTMIGERTETSPEDVISIQMALLNMALNCYPDRHEFANSVFETTAKLMDKIKLTPVNANTVIGRELSRLMKIPINFYSDAIRLLQLPNFLDALNCFDRKGHLHISSFLLENMIRNETLIETEEHMDRIFGLIGPMLYDSEQDSHPRNASANEDSLTTTRINEDFEEEQNLVAKIVHLIYNDDNEINFKILSTARKIFGAGGDLRLKHTLPSLLFEAFKLVLRISEQKSSTENFDPWVNKIFHFCMTTINVLRSPAEAHELALRFYLQSALVCDKIDFDKSKTFTYEFISKGFTVYEEEISESREQVQSIILLIGTIQKVHLIEENHDTLSNHCVLAASKLLKRPDQVLMLCLAARLFWYCELEESENPAKNTLKNGDRVLECLKKAGKISAQCMEDVVQCNLNIHILSTYMHFFLEGCTQISQESIENIVQKLREQILQIDPCPEVHQLNNELNVLVKHFNSKTKQSTSTSPNGAPTRKKLVAA